jgi:hypothetical protein
MADLNAFHNYVDAFEQSFNAQKRTLPQNAAFQVLCRELAHEMDLDNRDMRTTITVPIRPTQELVFELMFKPIMRAMYPEANSTTQLSKAQGSELMVRFVDLINQKFGYHLEVPGEN